MLAQELLERRGAAGADHLGGPARQRRVWVQPRRVARHADSQSPCRNASKLDRTNSSLPVGIGASIALSRGDPRPGTKEAPRQQGFPEEESRPVRFERTTSVPETDAPSPELRALVDYRVPAAGRWLWGVRLAIIGRHPHAARDAGAPARLRRAAPRRRRDPHTGDLVYARGARAAPSRSGRRCMPSYGNVDDVAVGDAAAGGPRRRGGGRADRHDPRRRPRRPPASRGCARASATPYAVVFGHSHIPLPRDRRRRLPRSSTPARRPSAGGRPRHTMGIAYGGGRAGRVRAGRGLNMPLTEYSD